MDYTNRFDGKGEIYAKARPKYAAALFEYFKTRCTFLPEASLLTLAPARGFLRSSFCIAATGSLR